MSKYEGFASLLEYPLHAAGPWAVPAENVEQVQELYIATFEMNPVCALEVGWHLYGENYERGEFLVRMRDLLRRYELPETSELPDHLTHALRLLDRMEPQDAEEFAGTALLPALAKMRAGLEGKKNPYDDVLARIEQNIRADYPLAAAGAHKVVFPIFQEAAHEW